MFQLFVYLLLSYLVKVFLDDKELHRTITVVKEFGQSEVAKRLQNFLYYRAITTRNWVGYLETVSHYLIVAVMIEDLPNPADLFCYLILIKGCLCTDFY